MAIGSTFLLGDSLTDSGSSKIGWIFLKLEGLVTVDMVGHFPAPLSSLKVLKVLAAFFPWPF